MVSLIFLMISCQTPAVNLNIQSVVIPIPLPPIKPGIQFSDTGEGLFLSYVDGRKLAVYLEELETYRKKLESIIEYQKKVDKSDK